MSTDFDRLSLEAEEHTALKWGRTRFLWTWLALALLATATGIALWTGARNAERIDETSEALAREASEDAAAAQESSDEITAYLRGEQGLPGVPGSNGEDGTPGLPGAGGEPGEPGEPGPRGERGETGPQGAVGLSGTQGPSGTVGPPGGTGPRGETGSPGEPGLRGSQGPSGERGSPGTDGTNGKDGANGTDGVNGTTGATGPQGPPGPAAPPTTVATTTVAGASANDTATTKNVQATCTTGQITGGGFAVVPSDPGIIVTASTPIGTSGWQATATVLSLPAGTTWQLFAFATCAQTTTAIGASSMPYGDLSEAEQAHFNEYANLRQITDWPGFTAEQDARKRAARTWCLDQRERIREAAEKEGKAGWSKAKRKERYAYLEPANLNRGAPKHEVRLPCPTSATDLEAAHIEEREVYLTFACTTDAQKARKQANVDWLVRRRKQLYGLQKADPKKAGRRARYEALCVATHYGSPYERWAKEHNKWGVPKTRPKRSHREQIVDWCQDRLGTSERPAGSNRGSPQPSGWQKRVYGGDGVPWCACFSVCSAWDAGIKGQGTASVQLNVNLARQGRGIFRGWTTDPSRVRPGDHCAIGGTSTHTGVVVGPTAYDTIEGNTSPGTEGSQYNGGTTARRQRKGAIVGWMLIREP